MSTAESVHPHVIVRFMAAVYAHRSVWFGVGLPDRGHDLVVPIPPPRGSDLTEEERRAVIDAARVATVATGFRRCVVFGPRDVVYVERDGAVRSSDQPPSGGVSI